MRFFLKIRPQIAKNSKKKHLFFLKSALYLIKLKDRKDDEGTVIGVKEGLRPEDMCFILQAKNGVILLKDGVKEIFDGCYLIGRKDKFDKPRKSTIDLMKSVNKKDYSIVLDHQPNDFDAEAKAKPDLVLCGHTHGGQLIPLGWTTEIFHTNDCRYGMVKRGNTTFFTSSGIAGWGIPFKSGAISEYVIVNVKEK